MASHRPQCCRVDGQNLNLRSYSSVAFVASLYMRNESRNILYPPTTYQWENVKGREKMRDRMLLSAEHSQCL